VRTSNTQVVILVIVLVTALH